MVFPNPVWGKSETWLYLLVFDIAIELASLRRIRAVPKSSRAMTVSAPHAMRTNSGRNKMVMKILEEEGIARPLRPWFLVFMKPGKIVPVS